MCGLVLQFEQDAVEHLAGETVEHQAFARTQGRHRHHRVAVVDQREVLFLAGQARGVEADRLVELKRIGRAPEIAVGQEQRVGGGIKLDRGGDVDDVEAAFGQRIELDLVLDCRKVDRRAAPDAGAAAVELGVQLNDEIIDVA